MPTEDVKFLPLHPDPLVLVVDDELTPRSIIARMVRSLGYRARSCQSGLAALRYLKAHPGEVRLLLADLGMPRMNGGELAERAKGLDPSLIAVLMATPGDPQVDDLLTGYGDLPFVPKPVSVGDLAEKLERLIGIPEQPTSAPRSMASARRRERRRPSGSHLI
jgi:CheY-like chemotaxis protein